MMFRERAALDRDILFRYIVPKVEKGHGTNDLRYTRTGEAQASMS